MTLPVPDELAPLNVGGKVTDVTHVRGAQTAADVAAAIAAIPNAVNALATGQAINAAATVYCSAASALNTVTNAIGSIMDRIADPVGLGSGTLTGLSIETGKADPWGGTTAVRYIASADNSAHSSVFQAQFPTGSRRVTLLWYTRPTITTGQYASSYVYANATALQVAATVGAGSGKNVNEGGLTVCESYRIRTRADGWTQHKMVWRSTNQYMYFYVGSPSAWLGDGVNGVDIAGVELLEESTTAVHNSGTSPAAITASAGATMPIIDRTDLPDEGWIDTTDAWYCNTEDRYFSVSALPAQLSGALQEFTFECAIEPHVVPVADAYLLRLTGATADMSLQITTAGDLIISRKDDDDAGATTATLFAGLPIRVAHVLTVTVLRDKVQIWINGARQTDVTFASATQCTFTACRVLGALNARIRDFAIFVPPIKLDTQAHHSAKAMAVACGTDIEPIDVWFAFGQSNMHENQNAAVLPTWGASCARSGGLYFNNFTNGVVIDHGWGRGRLFFAMPDNLTTNLYMDSQNSANCGSQMEFMRLMGRVAVIKFAVGGSPVSALSPGGAHWDLLSADVTEALATLKIPYRPRGVLMVWGESDSTSLEMATGYGAALRAFVTAIETLTGADVGSLRIVMNKVPLWLAAGYVAESRASLDALEAATPTSVRIVAIDDMPESDDSTHYRVDPTHRENGRRLALAARSL